MWFSDNYYNYVPAAMLCNSSSPSYHLQLQDYEYNHRPTNYRYCYYNYDPSYYNFIVSPLVLDYRPAPPPRSLYHYQIDHRRSPSFYDAPATTPTATDFRDDHTNTSLRKRRRISVQDANTTTSCRKRSHGFNVRAPLQVSKLPNTRCTFRNPSRFRVSAHRGREARKCPSHKRSHNFRTKIPLQVPKVPKTRWTTRNPSHFRASSSRKRKRLPPWIAPKEYSCNSLQASNVPKRRTTRNPPHFRASAPRKRKRGTPWFAPTEHSRNPLQVSASQKRSHKFRKWFPLRLSNQWRKRSNRSYACFRCKKQGHFALRCPLNTMDNKTKLSSSVVFVGQDGLQYSPPSLLCWCGLRCSLTTVVTRKKTSPKVYTCSLKRCKISRWEDEVKKDELVSVPICQCGAGFCRQYTESGDTEVGRKYFACPIKKGQGACAFFKLLHDESLTSNRNVDERISPLKFTKGNKKVEPMEVELECEEDTLKKTPKKCIKRLRDGAPKYDSSFSNAVVEIIDVPQSCSEAGYTEGGFHVRKKNIPRQACIEENASAVSTISHSCSYTIDLLPLREDWLMTAAMNLNRDLFKGWWGRLAYPPSLCLELPEPKPFYCCVFPSFDPIFVPQIVDKVDWQSQNHQSRQEILEGSLMFGAISDRFARVARDLRNKLISLLRLSDFRAHDYMDREAKITFTALDQLQVQSQPFCERVNKLIRSASILDKAQCFVIPSDQSYNDSQNHCNSKKRKRDDLIGDYDVAKADMENHKECLLSHNEEASRQKSMNFQVEARVSSCEAENKYHEARCAQISLDLIQSDKHLQFAEEDLRLLQQQKEEYCAAEAAYKKARIELGI